jgi:hypothetical protein
MDIITYIFRYQTNYGLGVVVVNATSDKEAKELAKIAGAWDTDDMTPVNPKIQGIILDNASSNNYF